MVVSMTIEELNNLEKQIKDGWRESLNNIQIFFKIETKNFEVKKDVIKMVSEIFENSLRLIEEEKLKCKSL